MSEESEIIEAVEDAKKPGVFKISDVLRDRSYPKTVVNIFVDEESSFIAADIDDVVKKMSRDMDKDPKNKELLKEYEAKVAERDKIIEEMGGTLYIFHLTGISEGKRDDLYEKALERFPLEHEVDRNPLTGEVTRKEKENLKRDKYFTVLLWQEHITKIVAPDGSEQNGITFEEASELRRNLPLASIGKITEAIEKMRTSTALFMMATDEGFLAKS